MFFCGILNMKLNVCFTFPACLNFLIQLHFKFSVATCVAGGCHIGQRRLADTQKSFSFTGLHRTAPRFYRLRPVLGTRDINVFGCHSCFSQRAHSLVRGSSCLEHNVCHKHYTKHINKRIEKRHVFFLKQDFGFAEAVLQLGRKMFRAQDEGRYFFSSWCQLMCCQLLL